MIFSRWRFIIGDRFMPDNSLSMRMKPSRKGDRFSGFVVGGRGGADFLFSVAGVLCGTAGCIVMALQTSLEGRE
jgi:hypothetical protein